ncbi:hypothetical protein HZS_4657 [Henneguya salminicola]|nr:hypothetical protein HZS_4657 [Henneguya salminicola]
MASIRKICMEERKHKLLLYFLISATLLHSLSINIVKDIIVPCGSSYIIPIQQDSTSWISSDWTLERNNGDNITLLEYEKAKGECCAMNFIYRECLFILDYGVHYLSLYQMSIILNNSKITFTSYSKKKTKGEILFSQKFRIIITDITNQD